MKRRFHHLSEMATDFGVIKRREQSGMVVAEGQARYLAERVEDDVAIGIDNVISSALVKVDDDLSCADVLNLV